MFAIKEFIPRYQSQGVFTTSINFLSKRNYKRDNRPSRFFEFYHFDLPTVGI